MANFGDTLLVKIIVPKGELLNNVAKMVVVPGSEGELGVLPGHTPLISSLKSGELKIYQHDNKIESRFFVDGGIVEISGQEVLVLAEFAVNLSTATQEQTQKNISDLEAKLSNSEDKKSLELEIKRQKNILELI